MVGFDSCQWLLEVISFSLVPKSTNLEKYDFGGVHVGLDRKTDKPLLMGGLDSYRWLLEVISFSLVPNLTDLEKFDFGGTCRFWGVRVGLDRKTGKRPLMGV